MNRKTEGEKGHSIRSFMHNNKGKAWFLVNMFFTIIYLTWRIFFTIPFEYGIVSIVAGIALLIVEALGMVEAFIHYLNMYSVENYPLPQVPKELFPDVDVFIATYKEDEALLFKTVNGCKHMKYPNFNKVHIYLCDDNRRPEIKALAQRMGINYLDRPDNEGAKAGNLNHALAHSTSPLVVTLDADMIPKSDFLMKTIPYFVDSDLKNKGREEKDQVKLGFVQTPQSFYNPDLFQFNLFSEKRIPNEQDYFYKDIQVARTRSNSVIYGGSNTVLRREALEAVGGFYTEAITEDFATGILMEKKGYVSLGVGEPLASGLSPTDLLNLIQQRVRWARGVIATGRKMRIFISSELTFTQKMNYWASIWYWYAPVKRLIYIMAPILYATFGFMVFKCTLIQVLIFWLPMYITSNISLRMLSGNIRTTKWTGIYETVLFPFMLLPILLESVGITLKKFKVTEKGNQKAGKDVNLLYLIPFLILIVLSVIGILKCVMLMFDSGSFGPIVVLFWLVLNCFYLIMSMLFLDGRIPYRKAERVETSIPCIVESDGNVMHGTTRDISENGISVLLDKPYYLEAESEAVVSFQWKEYEAKLKTRIVFVSQVKKQWNYSMRILDYMNLYESYLQILYDRVPCLPLSIKKDSGSFEDLKLNTTKRVEKPFFQKRQYPRILLNVQVECAQAPGGKVTLHDFNYVYANLGEVSLPDEIQLKITEHILFQCNIEKESQAGKRLFRVMNMEDLERDKKLYEELINWLWATHEVAMEQEEHKHKKQVEEQKKQHQAEKEFFDENKLV